MICPFPVEVVDLKAGGFPAPREGAAGGGFLSAALLALATFSRPRPAPWAAIDGPADPLSLPGRGGVLPAATSKDPSLFFTDAAFSTGAFPGALALPLSPLPAALGSSFLPLPRGGFPREAPGAPLAPCFTRWLRGAPPPPRDLLFEYSLRRSPSTRVST